MMAMTWNAPSTLWRMPALRQTFGLMILLLGLLAPDCCLNGQHAFGAGMARFGAICRSGA